MSYAARIAINLAGIMTQICYFVNRKNYKKKNAIQSIMGLTGAPNPIYPGEEAAKTPEKQDELGK
jgi:hypothetical protein